MPKRDFPKNDGEKSGLVEVMEEKHFNMYVVPIITWASFPTIHFRGNAALWLQTYDVMHNVDKGDD